MRFEFTELGPHKISKTVMVNSIEGFEHLPDFALCEVIPHLPGTKKDPNLELVFKKNNSGDIGTHYIIVYDGILSVGNVAIYQ